MGCDIHLYTEHKVYNHWEALDISNAGQRNYDFFGLMANGVRRDYDEETYGFTVEEPRGIPDDLSYGVFIDYYIRVLDSDFLERNCDIKTAKDYATRYGCRILKIKERNDNGAWVYFGTKEKAVPCNITEVNGDDKYFIEDPDFHSASYMSLEEYRQVLDNYYKVLKLDDESLTEEQIKKYGVYWEAIYAYLKTYEDLGSETRLVFWFDS